MGDVLAEKPASDDALWAAFNAENGGLQKLRSIAAKLVRALSLRDMDADDLLQQAWKSVLERHRVFEWKQHEGLWYPVPAGERVASPLGYWASVIYRRAIDQFRSARRQPRELHPNTGDQSGIANDSRSPEDVVADRDRLRRLFGSLTPEECKVIIRHEVLGETDEEIGASLVPPKSGKAVSQTRYRAFERMRRLEANPPDARNQRDEGAE